MINTITSGMILNQINYTSSKSSNNTEKMFGALSMSMGGDGKTISKEQFSSYVKKAEEGSVKISDKKLKMLKSIEKNWNELFDEKKIISMEDFQRNLGIFLPMFADDSTTGLEYANEKIKFFMDKAKKLENHEELKEEQEITNKKIPQDSETQALFDDLSNKVNAEEKGITKQNLKDYLKELLAKDDSSEDDYNVDFIINLASDFDNITGGKDYMTSFSKETEYQI